MEFLKSVFLSILTLLLVVSCSDKKESNPLSAKNSPPSLEIIGFVSETLTFIENSKYAFEFKVTDKEDNSLTVSAKSNDSSGVVEMQGTSSEGIYNANYTPFRKGQHIIEITVSDGLEKVNGNLTVNFIENNALLIIIPDNNIKNGDQIVFDGSRSSDVSGTIKKYYWFLESAGNRTLLQVGESNTFNYTVHTRVGTNQAGLMVEDLAGNLSDTSWVAFEVDNQEPIADFEYATDFLKITITKNNSTDFDPFDEVEYRWLINDIEQTDARNKNTPFFSLESAGDVSLKLQVLDKNGGMNEQEENISVQGGQPNAVLNVPNSTTNGRSLILDGSGSNAPGDVAITKYYFYLLDNGQQLLSSGSNQMFTFTEKLLVGNHEFGLIVENANSLQSNMAKEDVEYRNTDPLANFELDAEIEKIIVTSNTSSDIDPGDQLTYNWFVNSEIKSTDQAPQFDLAAGDYTITLRVSDSYGGDGEKVVAIGVPGKPIAEFVFPAGADSFTAHNNENIILDASNSEGGYLGGGIEKYMWYVKHPTGEIINLGETSTSQHTIHTEYPVGVNQIGLKVTNNVGYETDFTWKNLTIENTAPIAKYTYKISAAKFQIIIDSNTSSDLDFGDTISYKWFLNYSYLPEFDDQPTPTFNINPGYEYTLKLRVVDNHGAFHEKQYQFWVLDD